jgi:hypothetical protein
MKVRVNKQDDQFSPPNDGESLLILGIKDSLTIKGICCSALSSINIQIVVMNF